MIFYSKVKATGPHTTSKNRSKKNPTKHQIKSVIVKLYMKNNQTKMTNDTHRFYLKTISHFIIINAFLLENYCNLLAYRGKIRVEFNMENCFFFYLFLSVQYTLSIKSNWAIKNSLKAIWIFERIFLGFVGDSECLVGGFFEFLMSDLYLWTMWWLQFSRSILGQEFFKWEIFRGLRNKKNINYCLKGAKMLKN